MKKCECGNDLFKIEIRSECHTCEDCGAYDEDAEEYIYDEEIINNKGLDRTEVEEDGQCKFDTAFGSGCHMYTCSKCGNKSNIPFLES